MIGNSNDETSFPNKFLFTNRQVAKVAIFVNLLLAIHQLILSYQKLNYLR